MFTYRPLPNIHQLDDFFDDCRVFPQSRQTLRMISNRLIPKQDCQKHVGVGPVSCGHLVEFKVTFRDTRVGSRTIKIVDMREVAHPAPKVLFV